MQSIAWQILCLQMVHLSSSFDNIHLTLLTHTHFKMLFHSCKSKYKNSKNIFYMTSSIMDFKFHKPSAKKSDICGRKNQPLFCQIFQIYK